VIPEAIYDRIPERLVSANQVGLYGYNQVTFGAVENHKPTSEIINPQVGCLSYVPRMLS